MLGTRRGAHCLGLLAIVTLLAGATRSEDLVIPGPHADYNAIPLTLGTGRYQFVYGAALFQGPREIRAIAFSPNQSGSFSGEVTIRLGVTPVAVDALVTDFDANAPDGLTTVYQATAAIPYTGGPESFSLAFPLTSAFAHDPGLGNLLVDMSVTTGASVLVSAPGWVVDLSSVRGSARCSAARSRTRRACG